MYKGRKVIDVHGHLSTPPHFRAHAMNLIALRTPGEGDVQIPEPAMKAALDRHLRMLDERNIDVQMISPRPVAMLHWERPFLVESWSRATNNVIAKQCHQHPTRFVGIAQLPQSPEMNIAACVTELKRAVADLGFVGAILNPDPGGDRKAPGVDDPAWFPLYEAAEKLQATLIVHPSISRDPRIEKIPHSYQYNNLTEETLATLLYEHTDVFDRFPDLRVVVCHCGGALRRLVEHGTAIAPRDGSGKWTTVVAKETGETAGGSSTGVSASRSHAEHTRDISTNLLFDSCAYDPVFLEAAIKQRGPDRMLFGTEVPGTGSGVMNPYTNKPSDDVIATIDAIECLSQDDKLKIFHHNARKVFPLLKV
jgi:predicted TIM-barrel fold metal-dependent hydrolase